MGIKYSKVHIMCWSCCEITFNLFVDNDMDSNLPNSFTNFLKSEPEDIVSQPSDPTQLSNDSRDSNLIVHTIKKSRRSKNFSQEEDCLLVSAWLNTSKDPITGVEQQPRQFWARVHACFVENGGNLNNRSQISISNRWQEINREVGKFAGFITLIENRQQSGMTEESKINDAHQMYTSCVGKRFQLQHCWVILKKEPKWQFECASQHQRSNKKQKNHENASPASSTSLTPDSVSLGEGSEAFIYQNRSIGQKASKERLKRRQGKEKVGEITVTNRLKQFMDVLVEIEVKKNKIEKLC
ncbi:glutathione S-transferase [Salix suchowensis]|nr:glutathione S-transferase [Salix suchowensis]